MKYNYFMKILNFKIFDNCINIENCLFQAHVVSAFEQSLSNMTQRLQQLTATAEKKVKTL